jgi:twitching motility protein PilT
MTDGFEPEERTRSEGRTGTGDGGFEQFLASTPGIVFPSAPAGQPAAPPPPPEPPQVSLAPLASAADAGPTAAERSAEVRDRLNSADASADPEFIRAIEAVLEEGASDLHIVGDNIPQIRVHGSLRPVPGATRWSPERVASVLMGMVSEAQMEAFERDLELDLAFTVGDLARFRVNVYQDRTGLGAALRLIPEKIKPLAELGIPGDLAKLAYLPRGLVLVCGPTGSGKSTTLASIIDIVNANRPCHIVTVEDPIEFVHQHKRATINQREVGADTLSFSSALKHALRQDPDVILVGELRDIETISTALTAAETGHLVFATLHTQDAGQTIDRIIDVYPPHQQAQVRTQLASMLRAVVVQTLVAKASGTGRAVATEVMLTNPAIASLIRAGKSYQIRSVLQSGNEEGMHTLDQDLVRLVRSGIIEHDRAYELAQDVSEFEQLIGSRHLNGSAR